ncbi:MAG: hypothetical protein H8D45_26540 [Bacteroidetes bacterium]|nr:hypothetical protein [Bacteroidota bacterium]
MDSRDTNDGVYGWLLHSVDSKRFQKKKKADKGGEEMEKKKQGKIGKNIEFVITNFFNTTSCESMPYHKNFYLDK